MVMVWLWFGHGYGYRMVWMEWNGMVIWLWWYGLVWYAMVLDCVYEFVCMYVDSQTLREKDRDRVTEQRGDR